MKKFFSRYHSVLLIGILAFAFLTRIVRLNVPEGYIFDEVYHAVTAKLIARNDPWAFEWWNPPIEKNTAVDWLHPPYAKYTQALLMRVFGENSFAWRLSSVIFGVLVVWITYHLATELFKNRNLSLLAAFLASLDGLLLVQSRIAMNDIHVTFFILLTLWLYLKYRHTKLKKLLILAGISAGVAMGTKWSGVFALIVLVVFESKSLLLNWQNKEPIGRQKIFLLFVSLVVVPIVMYLASYSLMFMQGKSLFCFVDQPIEGQCYKEKVKIGPWQWEGYISHFAELHRQIWWYQTGLKATHGYQSRPWQWFFNLRPVWFDVKYQKGQIANIYAQGNTMLFWLGDLAVMLSVLIWLAKSLAQVILKLKSRLHLKTPTYFRALAELNLPKHFTFLVFAYFMVWLPWQLSPRIMFFYHYTPAVPLLAIILAYWLDRVKNYRWGKLKIGQVLLILTLVLCATNFLLFYPNWTGLPVPEKIFKPLYFVFKSWK